MPKTAQTRPPIDVLETVFVSIEIRIDSGEHALRGAGLASIRLPVTGSSLDDLGDRLGPSLQPLVDTAFQDYLRAQGKLREQEAAENA